VTRSSKSTATRKHRTEAANERWRFPVELSVYDRQPSLTQSEQVELQSLVGSRAFPTSVPRFYNYSGLERLFKPLHAILEMTRADTQNRHGVLAVVAEEMLHREKSYWGWTNEDWQDILTTGGKHFRAKYHTQHCSVLLDGSRLPRARSWCTSQ
jgi:hypothetical protein